MAPAKSAHETAPNLTTVRIETIAGREAVVIASASDPLVCNVVRPRDPEYAALRARATRKDQPE